MILNLLYAGMAFVGIMVYLTMTVAVARMSERKITKEKWAKDECWVVDWVLGISVAVSWLICFIYFAYTTSGVGVVPQWSGSGRYSTWVAGQGVSLGTKFTLIAIPFGIAAVAACIAAVDNTQKRTATAMGLLWPYLLFDVVAMRLGLFLFKFPSRWGTAIADVPMRREVAATKALAEKAEKDERHRRMEIDAGIPPMGEG